MVQLTGQLALLMAGGWDETSRGQPVRGLASALSDFRLQTQTSAYGD